MNSTTSWQPASPSSSCRLQDSARLSRPVRPWNRGQRPEPSRAARTRLCTEHTGGARGELSEGACVGQGAGSGQGVLRQMEVRLCAHASFLAAKAWSAWPPQVLLHMHTHRTRQGRCVNPRYTQTHTRTPSSSACPAHRCAQTSPRAHRLALVQHERERAAQQSQQVHTRLGVHVADQLRGRTGE